MAEEKTLDQPRASPTASRQRSSENATRIAAEISRLLAHYWAAHEDPRLRTALAGDWLADLRQFDPAVVAMACTQWRRAESKRPVIADIRRLCAEFEPPRPAAAPIDPAEAEHKRQEIAEANDRRSRAALEAADWRQRFAEERGFANYAEVIGYGIVRAWTLPASDRSTMTPSEPSGYATEVPTP